MFGVSRVDAQMSATTPFSLDELWKKLSNEKVGFYTSRFADRIPSSPGVYAWFYPMRMHHDPEALLGAWRQMMAYDSNCGGVAEWKSVNAGFTWDPLIVEVRRDTEVRNDAARAAWPELANSGHPRRSAFAAAMMYASIFARPLYVGLTKSLATRYNQHIRVDGDRTGFNRRFTDFVRAAMPGVSLSVEDLLFVAVRLGDGPDEAQFSNDDELKVLESILKTLCQPVFGAR